MEILEATGFTKDLHSMSEAHGKGVRNREVSRDAVFELTPDIAGIRRGDIA